MYGRRSRMRMKAKKRQLKQMLEKNYGLLSSNPKDSTVWKMRCSLVGDYLSCCKEKLDLVRDFAEEHPDSDWTSRLCKFEKIGSEVAKKELECTKKFVSKGTNNNQAWSYREWIIQNIDKSLWKSELQFCHKILDKDKFDVSVWIQMCRATRQLNHKMGKKSRKVEALYAKEAIIAHPGNEAPWTYLKVLYAEHKETLYTDPDLECIFIDVLAEAADREELARELDPDYNPAYSSVSNRGSVHALNLILDLMIYGYKMNKRRLVNAVNVLYAYPRRVHSRFPIHKIQNFGILWKVCSAMFLVDPYRVRFFHKYCAFHWVTKDLSLFFERGSQFAEAMDDEVCDDDGEDLSTQSMDLQHTVFEKHPNWKNRLSQTYLKKGRRPDYVKVDLKWDIRRCVAKDAKDEGTEAVAKEELRYTKDLIKVNAYDHHAWLHRQWVFQTFGGDWDDVEEFDFCGAILENDACNSFAWDQRYFLVTRKMQKREDFKKGFDELEKEFWQQKKFLQQEANYAITKFILVEPGNPFPWAHILGVYNLSFHLLVHNDEVLDAIERVLVNNNDGHLMDNAGGIMDNAGGIINALNMLLDLVRNNHYDVFDNEKFRNIMDKLCPDSCLVYEYTHNTYYKIIFVLQRMVKALPDLDLSWENAADKLLTGCSSVVLFFSKECC